SQTSDLLSLQLANSCITCIPGLPEGVSRSPNQSHVNSLFDFGLNANFAAETGSAVLRPLNLVSFNGPLSIQKGSPTAAITSGVGQCLSGSSFPTAGCGNQTNPENGVVFGLNTIQSDTLADKSSPPNPVLFRRSPS
ncbi:unnamed protein product, partial [Protopolystoma xenopodis]